MAPDKDNIAQYIVEGCLTLVCLVFTFWLTIKAFMIDRTICQTHILLSIYLALNALILIEFLLVILNIIECSHTDVGAPTKGLHYWLNVIDYGLDTLTSYLIQIKLMMSVRKLNLCINMCRVYMIMYYTLLALCGCALILTAALNCNNDSCQDFLDLDFPARAYFLYDDISMIAILLLTLTLCTWIWKRFLKLWFCCNQRLLFILLVVTLLSQIFDSPLYGRDRSISIDILDDLFRFAVYAVLICILKQSQSVPDIALTTTTRLVNGSEIVRTRHHQDLLV